MDAMTPLGACLAWSPIAVTLSVASDILLFLAYMAIPTAILIYAHKKKTEYPKLFYGAAAFVFWVGCVHAVGAVSVFYPMHITLGVMKAITACVAVIGAIALFPIIPRLVALRTPQEYETYAHTVAQDNIRIKNELDTMTAHARTLMAELTRRTQNVLANVQAHIKETAKTTDSVHIMTNKLNSRIMGMARCQDTLNNNAWKGVSMKELIQSQLDAFPALAHSVELEGPDMFIRPEAAQQLSLAVHELAANTTKHAVNSRGTTGLDCKVSWDIAPSGRAVRFNWAEKRTGESVLTADNPFLEKPQPEHKGFGRMILEYVVPTHINGFSELRFDHNSTVYELEAPSEQMLVAA